MKYLFSERSNKAKASEIREILKLTEKPEVISFAGGLPAPELFPVEDIKKVMNEVMEKEPYVALQYSTTEGYPSLRESILNQRLKPHGMNGTIDNILITSGSQQALDLSGKVFFNEGDVVIVENPSYLGAINVLKTYGVKFVEVEMDDDGIIIEKLEEAIKNNQNVKLIYTIPDFQNPTGKCLPVERRKALAEVAAKYKIPVIEDAPYAELMLEGNPLPSVKSFDKEGYVIYFGSFSKTFCPGFRIGWVFADAEIINKYVIMKQSSDLQTSTIDQRIVGYYMNNYDLNKHIEKIKSVYTKRKDLMLSTMEEYFPKAVKFTRSKGGLFTWVELKEDMDSVKLLEEALEENVAFVPGISFFPKGDKKNFFRLNYSNMPEERIVEGIKRLSKVLKKHY